MRSLKTLVTLYTLIVIMFFLPIYPIVSKSLESLHPLTLSVYWITLTLVSIVIGLRALKGVEQ